MVLQQARLLTATARLAAAEVSQGILAEENARLRELLADVSPSLQSLGADHPLMPDTCRTCASLALAWHM